MDPIFEPIYVCGKCGAKFSSMDALEKHIETAHPGYVEDLPDKKKGNP